MQAGKMREKILIYTPCDGKDDLGLPVFDPTTVVNCHAWIVAKDGSEATQGDAVKSKTTYTVVMRYISGIDSTQQITWGAKTLKILSVIPDERRTQLTLSCVEVQ